MASSDPTNPVAGEIPIEIVEEKILFHGKWLGARQIIYKHRSRSPTSESNPENDSDITKLPMWQVAYRASKPKTAKVDGVGVIATLIKSSPNDRNKKDKYLVLVKQFRIPLMKYSLEFPAGLLDPKETALEAGLRELKEETGYTATKIYGATRGVQCLDPGLTDDSMNFVLAEIDGDQPENRDGNVKQNLDQHERIDVVLVPFDRILESFRQFIEQDIYIEAMVYSFGIGTIFNNGQVGDGLVL